MSAHMDALGLAGSFQERLVNLALDDHGTNNPELNESLRRIWAGPGPEGGLVGDIWVEGAFPSALSDKTIAHLVDEGVFNHKLANRLKQRAIHILFKSASRVPNACVKEWIFSYPTLPFMIKIFIFNT